MESVLLKWQSVTDSIIWWWELWGKYDNSEYTEQLRGASVSRVLEEYLMKSCTRCFQQSSHTVLHEGKTKSRHQSSGGFVYSQPRVSLRWWNFFQSLAELWQSLGALSCVIERWMNSDCCFVQTCSPQTPSAHDLISDVNPPTCREYSDLKGIKYPASFLSSFSL